VTPFVVVLLSMLQTAQSVDEFTTLARVGPDSVLVARMREAPDDGREALRGLLARAAVDIGTDRPLAAADRLAQAYAVAWRDSFLLRQVARFTAWSPTERRTKVEADSLRRAGNAALSQSGVDTALRLWRESLSRCTALNDSAGMGAALGNIGTGFREAGALDSAERYLGQARTIAEHIGDQRTAGNAVGMLAAVRMDRGDLGGAQQLYAVAAGVRERIGDTRGAASDQNNLGLIAQTLGDWDGARRAFTGALALNRRASRDEAAATNLTNLGNIASLAGEYVEAAARYDDALALYRSHGSRVDVAFVLHNLGLLELARGDYRAALRRLTAALAIYRETGPMVEVIGVRRSLAIVAVAMGDLGTATRQLSRAERLAAGRGVPASLRAELDLSRADLATVFNALPEAERRYGEAGRLYRRIGDASGLAAAQQGAGIALLLQEEYPKAQAALELALLTEERSTDARSAALVRLLLGYAQRHRGDFAAARRTLTEALDTLRSLGDPVAEAAAFSALGDLQSQSGLTLAAESLYRSGLARLDTRPAPSVLWQLHAGLGRTLWSRGALAEAAAELGAAVAALERVSGGLPLEERRSAFLADKWDVYAQLALVEQARGRTAAAFAASERMRAREILDLLARGRLVAQTPGQVSPELLEREQDLRHRITALTQALEGGHTAGTSLRGLVLDGPAADAAREALARAEEEYAAILREARAARPEYAALVSGEIASPAEVRQALAQDEALLEYLVSDSTTIAFVVTTDTFAAFDLNVGHHELITLVDFARGTLTRPRAGATENLWRAPLRRLYQYLIAPLEASGLLTRKHSLLIGAHAELHYLPFAALLSTRKPDEYLVQRYRITLIPSASVWLRLKARGVGPALPGVLALAPRVDALPGSAAEIASIGRIFGTHARMLVGPAASESALRALAPSQGIVHLATYGVLNKDNPLFSFVELAPRGEGDGRLEVHEVFELALSARLVVLSACRTALGAGALDDVPQGDDWVGLVQAFLYAGASDVMATLWPVEDRATARFMERFYTALAAGQSEADALAAAQQASLSNPRTAHPFYWAGFTMNGR
jgi:CHAT domain-containing protein/tetratricopeptide (TPR) repeat protein